MGVSVSWTTKSWAHTKYRFGKIPTNNCAVENISFSIETSEIVLENFKGQNVKNCNYLTEISDEIGHFHGLTSFPIRHFYSQLFRKNSKQIPGVIP